MYIDIISTEKNNNFKIITIEIDTDVLIELLRHGNVEFRNINIKII